MAQNSNNTASLSTTATDGMTVVGMTTAAHTLLAAILAGGCLLAAGEAAAQTVSIEGTAYTPVEVRPEASTGLSAVYVAPSCVGASIAYRSKNTSHPAWYTYGQLGASYAEPIADGDIDYDGNTSTLRVLRGDGGYVIEDGNLRTYFWLTDYSAHELKLNSLTVSDESDCSTMALTLDGEAGAIYYYDINGRRHELARELTLSYATMEYSDEYQEYIETEATESLASAGSTIHCAASLCDTEYTLSGDRFLRAWDFPDRTVSTALTAARRVEARTSVAQTTESYDNQQSTASGSDGSLGGSAPVDITFTAAVTPAAIFTEWQLSSYPEFDDISLRDSNQEYSRTFAEAGTTYVRFVAADASGACEYYSETYQVEIGESDLHCPNAFSPQGSPGVNDEWKVSYRSITEFKCSIFNRWGTCIATLDHPSQGWDGKYKGKYVGSGVYYYVIKARGSDGRAYNLKGDINIINYDESANQDAAAPPAE